MKLNNHDLAQQRQKDIYGSDKVFVLEKKDFFDQIIKKKIKNIADFKEILLEFPNKARGNGFLKERNTSNLFSSYLVLENTENIIKVNAIENNVITYLKKLKGQKFKNTTDKDKKLSEFNSFEAKTLIEYLSLQKARSINNKLCVLDYMIMKNYNYQISKEEAKFYQQDFNNYLIKTYFNNLKIYSCEICHFERITVLSPTLKNNLIFFSEYDVVNGQFFYNLLKGFKQNVKILTKYYEYLKNIELMVINQNILYIFVNKKYLELSITDREIIHNFIVNNWNTFTILSCFKYAIVSKEKESIEYITNILYDLYVNNYWDLLYKHNPYSILEDVYTKLKQNIKN
jgi:hypothetical protein